MFILDASVIISFYRELDDPDILHALTNCGHKLVVPSRVYAEIKGDAFATLSYGIKTGIIVLCSEIDSNDCNSLKIKYPALSNGEIEVILLGLKLKTNSNCICVLDDKKARSVARNYKLNIIGTIGLLDYMCDKDIISKEQKDKLIKVLESSSFRR
jgi:predicted nucleic acid-binding protein